MDGFRLSPRQQRVVAAALTLIGVAAIAVLLYATFLLLARFIRTFSPVLTPLAVAAILALILRPYYEALLKRVRWPWLAATVVLISVLLPLALGLWFFGSVLVKQAQGLLQQLPVWIERASSRVEEWAPQLSAFWADRGDAVKAGLQEKGGWLASQLVAMVRRVISAGFSVFHMLGGLLSWVVLPVYFYFLLTAKPVSLRQMEGALPFLKEETRRDVLYLVREFVNIMVAFFRGQIGIAAIQSVLYAIGFGVVGLQYGIALGLIFGFLNVIPYLGNIVGLAVTLPLAYFQPGGGIELAAFVLAIIAVVNAIESFVLTPRIMGDRTGLHPMAVILSLFFWGAAFGGVLGMLLGIPLTAFLVVFWRLLKAKYIREVL
ncbi:MAG: AI-2E family transporter [Kiritimatiellae bacterium]|nr:AI-2E family transporter [Kiritimatiellia bacterium]